MLGQRSLRPIVLNMWCAIFTHAVCVAAQPAAPASSPPPPHVVYGADESFRPFEWRDADGGVKGFQVDLIRAIAEVQGWDLEVRCGPWQSIKDDYLDGVISIVGMFDQPARRQYAEFSEPLIVQSSEIFVRRGSPELKSLEELSGKSVIVQAGALAEEYIVLRGITVTFTRVASEQEAIRALALGNHDGAIMTQYGGLRAIQKLGLEGQIISSSSPILTSDVCFAVRQGDRELLDQINQGLGRLRASGRFNDIYRYWFGDVDRPAVPLRIVRNIALFVGVPVLLLAGSVVWGRVLRHQVDVRTVELRDELAERRRAEASLRESENLLQTVIRNAKIMVFTQDRDLRFTWVYNPTVPTPPGSLIGRSDADVWPAELVPTLTAAKRRVLDSGVHEELEIDLREPGIGPAAVDCFIDPLRDEAGHVTGLTCAAVDITELRKAEQHRADLEARVHQSQRLESLGLLAGGIAHDFNNLLAGVLGNASIALADLAAESPARERLGIITEIATRATELTHQLLTYTGRRKAELAGVNLSGVAEEMVRLLRGTLPANISVTCDADPNLPEVSGDPTQVRQVILNLIKNAADAIGDVPGTLAVRTYARSLDQRDLDQSPLGADAAPGLYACIEVRDSGKGIDQAAIARIFDPFFTTKPNGRGLGLAVVSGTVRRHLGVARISSGIGLGTTVCACFPVRAGDRRTTNILNEAGSPADAPERDGAVLVLDDTRSVRDLLVEGLSRAGFATRAVDSGPDAIEVVRSDPGSVCAAVIDMNMPGMDGLSAFREIRRLRPGLRVVLISGLGHRDAEHAIRGDTHAMFLEKPFLPHELSEAVRDLLGRP